MPYPKRSPEDKYKDFEKRGRNLAQMRAVAGARGDDDFRKYVAERERIEQADVFA